MRQPHHYVVRIYRRGFSTLEGLVEDVRSGTEHAFSTMEELWRLLREPARRRKPGDASSSESRPIVKRRGREQGRT
jgi:hypothetical protein